LATGTGKKPRHPIESVNNALLLLAMVGNGRVRISEASRRLGVVPSTAHRLMAMLEYHGFVVQNPETRAYEAGPTLTEVGIKALRGLDSRENLRALLTSLVDEVGETAHLQTLAGHEALFVDGVESGRPVSTILRLGDRSPAHCTSGGKALLAELSREDLRALFAGRRLASCTDRTLTRIADLEADLGLTRERGYALSIAENEPEIAAVAIPIRDPVGNLLGAFSVSMPISRYDEDRLAAVLAALKRVAAEASAGFE
jgi:DNA-binding IclR family transcriptional regulator